MTFLTLATEGRDCPTYTATVRESPQSAARILSAMWVYRSALDFFPPFFHTAGYACVVDGGVCKSPEASALDARNGAGSVITTPRTGACWSAAGGITRGAPYWHRVFMVTTMLPHCAASRKWPAPLGAGWSILVKTMAPPCSAGCEGSVISGTSEEGVRGFLARIALTPRAGMGFWTFRPGNRCQKLIGSSLSHGCASLPRHLRPRTDLLTGRREPCPDYNGDQRREKSLFGSVLALKQLGQTAVVFTIHALDLHVGARSQAPMLRTGTFPTKNVLLVQAT